MAAMEDSAGVMPVSASDSGSGSAFCWLEENWREGVVEMGRRMVRWEALKAVGLKEGRAGRARRRWRRRERQDEQIMVRLMCFFGVEF